MEGATAGVELVVSVERGGGSVPAARVTTDADGSASIAWTLGIVPVDNTLRVVLASDAETAVEVTVRATLAEPLRAEAFADVDAFLTAEGHDGSTEDLTFTDDGLLLGVPEGLIRVGPDGNVTRRAIDEGVAGVWGFAVDGDGVLWAVDAGNDRLISIAPDGTVDEALTTDGQQPLDGPNYVAVGHDGRVYLSDPCLGEIIRLDPTTGDIAVHTFDLVTEGGPNGMAVSPDGSKLYVATENTGLLCQHTQVTFDAEIAGVYILDLTDFTTRTPLAEGIGLFGDGLAFDVEGNLYVVVDTQANLALEESAVVVFPAGESTGITFLVAGDKSLFANVAFGRGAYGDTTLYIAMLALVPFTTPDSRGLERLDIGIAGLPLLP